MLILLLKKNHDFGVEKSVDLYFEVSVAVVGYYGFGVAGVR